MPLEPYSHYAEIGSTAAYARWNSWMKFFVTILGVVGIVVGVVVGKSIEFPILGAFAGGAVGYLIFRLIVYYSAASTADELYRTTWCDERGMTYRGDDNFPANAPHADSGDRRKATDAFEGQWNGLQTFFYNFTYTVTTTDSDGDSSDTDYHFKIMRLTGRELPIARLTMQQRSLLKKFKWADTLHSKFSPERSVSLESTDFNNKFDLMIDDRADDVWIRRIFDPATIQMLVGGQFTIPNLKYYDGAWWFVEKDHYKISELETWPPKQKLAADAVELLSRVQSL